MTMAFHLVARRTLKRSLAFLGVQNGIYASAPWKVSQEHRCMSLSEESEQTRAKIKSLKQYPGNEERLQMYALFKQATRRKVNISHLGNANIIQRAKWDVWNSLADCAQGDAKRTYTTLVNSLLQKESSKSTTNVFPDQNYKYFSIEREGGLFKVIINRPQKKNAVSTEVFHEWSDALTVARDDPSVVITALTGTGDIFCAGLDISSFVPVQPDQEYSLAASFTAGLQRFIGTLIEFPKPIVAVVNGPAYGIGVTLLGLVDVTYASDKAVFVCPLKNIGLTPGGTSSYMFPKIMGPGMASEVLLFSKALTAREAQAARLVTEVYPDTVFQEEVWAKLKMLAKLPSQTLTYGKQIFREHERETLHKVAKAECDIVLERLMAPDFRKAVEKFMKSKK